MNWAKKEVDFLIENYNKLPTKELCEFLGREPKAVYSKYKKINKQKEVFFHEDRYKQFYQIHGLAIDFLKMGLSLRECVNKIIEAKARQNQNE